MSHLFPKDTHSKEAYTSPKKTIRIKKTKVLSYVSVFVVQERLNKFFGFCTIWKGGLRGYETSYIQDEQNATS